MNENLEKELQKLKSMGIDFGFDEKTTDQEKEEAINSLAEVLGNYAEQEGFLENHFLHTEEDCSLNILCELTKDIDPQPESTLELLTKLADEPQEDLADDKLFVKNGLFELYEILGKRSLIMTVDHSDPIEIGRLLNHMIKLYSKEPISDEILESIEDKMFDTDDDYEYVWEQLQKELFKRQLALIELVPIKGVWSDRALIIMKKDKVEIWQNRGFGDYGLLPFYYS